MKREKKKITKLLPVFIVLAVAVITILIFFYAEYKLKKDGDYYKKLETGFKKNDGEVPFIWDYFSLLEQNSDAKGWIYIKDVVNYPIVQGNDNSFYLEHALDGSYSYLGTPFIDAFMPEGLNGKYCVVYGHNISHSEMFGTLHQYSDAEFMKSHQTAHVFIEHTHYKYKVFASVNASVTGPAYSFDPYKNSTIEFTNWVFSESVANIQNYDFNESDHILALSTCTPNSDKNTRFVVFLVREEELLD